MKGTLRFLVICLLLSPILVDAQENRDSIVVEFGLALQDSIDQGNYGYLNEVFDSQYFKDKFIYEDSSNVTLGEYNSGVESGITKVIETIVKRMIDNGFSYNLINYYEASDSIYYLTFRMYGEQGFNYHEFEVIFDEEGVPWIGDIFVYLSGEFLSETLKSIYSAGLSEILDEEGFSTFSGQMKYVLLLVEIKKLIAEGKREAAQMIYEGIPEEIRMEHVFLLYGIQIYDPIDDQKKYEELVSIYSAQYPSNACVYLLGIDLYASKGEYEKSIEMVDSLISITGDDLLPYVKGKIYHEMEDYINAENMYEYIAENFPYFEDNWFQLLALDIETKKHDQSIRCLDRLIEDCGYEKEGIVDFIITEYTGFAEEEVFKAWSTQ